MGGSQGGYGQLAQSANPQVADPMQNQNRLGFPNGRRIMGGGTGQPMPGPRPDVAANTRATLPMQKPGGSNPLGYGEDGRMGTAKPMPMPQPVPMQLPPNRGLQKPMIQGQGPQIPPELLAQLQERMRGQQMQAPPQQPMNFNSLASRGGGK